MQTTPFPEADSPELERFTLYARLEIISLLQQLRDEGTLVTAYFGAGTDFAVTILLQVQAKADEVIFDQVSDPAAQRRLLAADQVTFVAFLANVKIQFTTDRTESVTFDGKAAFRVKLPDELLRLQRRDSFRVRTPMSKPATVLVPCPAGSNQYESLRVLDLSVGGMAVVSTPHHAHLEFDALIENCFLDLPGVGEVQATVRVRHVRPLPGDSEARYGCQFTNLSPRSRLMLQRYVNKVDADQRKVLSPPGRVGA